MTCGALPPAQVTPTGEDICTGTQASRQRLVNVLVIALGAAIPLSVAAANVLIALLALAWLSGGRVTSAWRKALAHPVARAALILLAVLAVGTLYGHGTLAARWNMMGKYLDLMLLVPLSQAFADTRVRCAARRALLGAIALTLVLSWLIALGVLPDNGALFKAVPGDASVFKDHITQSILMAFAAFVWMSDAVRRGPRWRRVAGAVLAAAAVIDILFFVEGRTGYVVLMMLALYLFVGRFGLRGALIATLALVTLGFVAYHEGPSFRLRVDQAVRQVERWRPDRAHKSPVGLRLDFYETSLRIIRRHPLIGVGTGGFVGAYAHEAARFHMETTHNPHNQFLLVMIETGLPGLVALIALFTIQWRAARSLPRRARMLARGLLCTLVIGCLLNSLLIDFTERLFYVFGTALFSITPEDGGQ